MGFLHYLHSHYPGPLFRYTEITQYKPELISEKRAIMKREALL
jgi:hypothetical protein